MGLRAQLTVLTAGKYNRQLQQLAVIYVLDIHALLPSILRPHLLMCYFFSCRHFVNSCTKRKRLLWAKWVRAFQRQLRSTEWRGESSGATIQAVRSERSSPVCNQQGEFGPLLCSGTIFVAAPDRVYRRDWSERGNCVC